MCPLNERFLGTPINATYHSIIQQITLIFIISKKTFSITPIACKQKKRLPLPVFQIKNSWRWRVCKIEFTPLFFAYGRKISEIMKQKEMAKSLEKKT